jgi:hypothetical protein
VIEEEKMKKIGILLSSCLLLYGCGVVGMRNTDPKPKIQQLLVADYGLPPTDYEWQLIAYWQKNLDNPVGALLKVGRPNKAWDYVPKNPTELFDVSGSKVVYGYGVCGFLNTQNKKGKYTGKQIFYAFFVNGRLIILNDIPTQVWERCNSNLTIRSDLIFIDPE